MNLKGKGAGAKFALIGAVLALIAAIGCIIYGVMYSQYFDIVIILGYIVGAAVLVAYVMVDNAVIDWFNLVGVTIISFCMGLFITNSYNVWADTNGNLSQYGSLTGAFNFFGSEGGPIPAAILIVIGLLAVIFGIICCFKGKGAKA